MPYQNFFATKISADIGAADTTITLDTVPTVTSGRLVLEARNTTQREIVSYTGVSGNQITGVTRGIGGTTAKTHIKGSLVEMNVTAEDLEDALAVPSDIITRFDESLPDYVSEGLVWSQVSLLTGAMTAGVIYISGYRIEPAAVASYAFPASKDVYVDIDVTGTLYYTDVANGAASPALTSGRVRLAKVVTDATTITSVTQSGRDSIDNPIYPLGIGIFRETKYMTATGTYSKPAGLKFVIVECQGGGGGSGGCASTGASPAGASSGGGGGGGYARKKVLADALSASETVTVGAAGAAGASGNNTGGGGGTSSFGSHFSATGGGGGAGGAGTGGTTSAQGGTGGSGSSGHMNCAGSGGGSGFVYAGQHLTTNTGGNSVLGGGGIVNGGGRLYGGGGGGRILNASSAAQPGHVGAAGIVIIHEYF